jgi:hypothetical protein
MRTGVQQTVSRCIAVLRQLRGIRRSMLTDVFQTLVISFVLSCLDYGNAVLTGLLISLVRSVQSVQNAVTRLIYGLQRYIGRNA